MLSANAGMEFLKHIENYNYGSNGSTSLTVDRYLILGHYNLG